ncbi:hypothetical protein TrLO_g5558 [Triparma laevis f. longispina]|uniref:Uncharacterized protein n=1 Tax=Triparma laevis f. longispina TaxID=1714387 RepID=A0A9W7F4V8_9STRA|nr:hypothetical protein TrLO_g5558 [Triparma laevis f. longispina]
MKILLNKSQDALILNTSRKSNRNQLMLLRELFKNKALVDREFIHDCFNNFLKALPSDSCGTMKYNKVHCEEDHSTIITFCKRVGPLLDSWNNSGGATEKGEKTTEEHFKCIWELKESYDLTPKIRKIYEYLFSLRTNRWQPRKIVYHDLTEEEEKELEEENERIMEEEKHLVRGLT